MECEFPSVNADRQEIKNIFKRVKTIAILGLSPDPRKDSHRVAKYLQEQGYKIIPIYPKTEDILGEKVYKSLLEVPQKIDMLNIFRKPKALDAIAEIVIQRGDIEVFWAQIGIVNNEAAKKVQESGVVVIQNKCSMVEHKGVVC